MIKYFLFNIFRDLQTQYALDCMLTLCLFCLFSLYDFCLCFLLSFDDHEIKTVLFAKFPFIHSFPLCLVLVIPLVNSNSNYIYISMA